MDFILSGKAKEERLRLQLLKTEEDGVCLSVVDEDGYLVPGGNLILVESSGKFRRMTHVNPDFGFPLDAEGRIELV